ncbi:alpha/beta-hydrolase [Periconia macrospinosa]|uniref:Alpha/beta-hydrolase n=1 Tax=Periconia macrospinosa TaxID=97972 RepID=A0A2V1DX53_9PLEO|nr:alpha/beta-hydrolase [Periconia macrospinosa]
MKAFSRPDGSGVVTNANIFLFGTNIASVNNPDHISYLFDNNFRVITSKAVQNAPVDRAREALQWMEDRVDAIVVHLDVDVIDPGTFPLSNVPNWTGLEYENCLDAVRVFLGSAKLAAVDMLPCAQSSSYQLLDALSKLLIACGGHQGTNKKKLVLSFTPRVHLPTGSYTGLIEPSFPNTRQFRAIPFAKPPVSQLRWLPPQKLDPSPNKTHVATRFPPSCPQFVSAVISLFNIELTRGNLIYNGNQNDTSGLVGEATSEDCLHVAVWTPTTPPPEGGFPVLFFMTGGGWLQGGIDVLWQMPHSIVERSQSTIVVTINYRLNIFGFPAARGLPLEHQNLGLLDQRAALEWLFLQSGNIFSASLPKTPPYSNFSFVAQNVGCGGFDDDTGAAELDCMRQVPMALIENFIGQYGDRGELPALSWKPVVDNRLVFADYKARAEAGLVARVPYIISTTANEFSSLVPWPIKNLTAGPDQTLVTYYDVMGFVCPTFNSTVYRNRLGPDVPVYRFQHAGTFPNLNKYEWLGAYHASDIPISFGTYHLLDHVANTTQFEIDVSQAMQDHMLAFVKDPYHGPQKDLGWKPMNTSEPNGGDLIRFGAGGKVIQHIDGVEVDGVCLGLREYDPFP